MALSGELCSDSRPFLVGRQADTICAQLGHPCSDAVESRYQAHYALRPFDVLPENTPRDQTPEAFQS